MSNREERRMMRFFKIPGVVRGAKQPQPEATPSAAEFRDAADNRSMIGRAGPLLDRVIAALAAQERRAAEAEKALREIANAPKGGPLAAKARRALAQGDPDAP